MEGPFLVEEALNAAPRVKTHSVLVASGAAEKFSALLERLPAEAEMTQVPDRLFESVAQTQSPQGIAALVELPAYKLEQVVAARNPLLVVACRLQDPGNLGTMMRTALAFSAIGLPDFAGDGEPVQSQGGALFGGSHLPASAGLRPRSGCKPCPFLASTSASWRRSATARHRLRKRICGDRSPSSSGAKPRDCREEIARYASQLLSIPIRKEVDSVNAATAASIFLYEAARQRGFRY